jgi:hypothetical protein
MEKIIGFRGNPHKRNEIIDALIEMGGVNKFNFSCGNNDMFYCIRDGIICEYPLYLPKPFSCQLLSIEQYKTLVSQGKDKGKELNTDMNEVYDAISTAYEKMNDFFIKHCAFQQTNMPKKVHTELYKLYHTLGNCKENAHEIAKFFTWDN